MTDSQKLLRINRLVKTWLERIEENPLTDRPPENVQVNAPVALEQMSLKAKRQVLTTILKEFFEE